MKTAAEIAKAQESLTESYREGKITPDQFAICSKILDDAREASGFARDN